MNYGDSRLNRGNPNLSRGSSNGVCRGFDSGRGDTEGVCVGLGVCAPLVKLEADAARKVLSKRFKGRKELLGRTAKV